MVRMDADGKKSIAAALDKLSPSATTNLWGGLKVGLDTLREAQQEEPAQGRGRGDSNSSAAAAGGERFGAVFLLTDGLPNVAPPKSHLDMLKSYRDEHTGFRCAVNTFGFGYSLDSPLLCELSEEGEGSYAFIPDSAMVGTVFVNALGNLLATCSVGTRLAIEMEDGYEFVGCLGGTRADPTSWGAQVNVGSVRYGQCRDVVFAMRKRPGSESGPCAVVTLPDADGGAGSLSCNVSASVSGEALDAEAQLYRAQFVEMISKAMAAGVGREEAHRRAADFATALREAPAFRAGNAALVALEQDVSGQVEEALSKDEYWTKWGRHYVPSLQQAHRQQCCNNFKDPGVQVYGGDLFKSLRDGAEDVFLALPAPKPSRATSSTHTVSSMGSYYNSGAPCFAGECAIRLAGTRGGTKPLNCLARGDIVWTPHGAASVRCVVKTRCQGGATMLCELGNGMLVTPFHPVKVGGKWVFPADVVQPSLRPCPAVYSVLLEKRSGIAGSFSINGIEAVALGHGITADPVASHDYFGNFERVSADLLRCNKAAWERGLVELAPGCTLRDPLTNKVARIGMVSAVHEVQAVQT